MFQWTRIVPAVVAVAALVASAAYLGQGDKADAADHTDPPMRIMAGDAADIGDIYAWHGDGTMKVVLTFAGPVAPVADQTATWDPDVLYGVHIDNNGDNAPDRNIWVRFGQNALGEWGVQVENVPGAEAAIVGAVETTIEAEGAKVYAGLKDDPFFFDLQGFQDTLANETLSFDGGRDFFAGQNISAVVLEFPTSELGGTEIGVWATTGRIN